nr:MAG TPA: hypothetical protein [Caudoviricetes sp.]
MISISESFSENKAPIPCIICCANIALSTARCFCFSFSLLR